MQISDTIADMLARIRNGQMAKKESVACPSSKLRKAVLEVLKEEGFITSYDEKELRAGVKELTITLRYFEGEGAIKEVKKVSKPGRRVYSKSAEIPAVMNGLGVAILSTAQGVMADHTAREKNLGGEIICTVF
ncbi:MAG: 30S ribosomal protein S8 [Alphaproteobacteria bacterium]|jgi:small subunit ribosomal protein S8|nr:30S ribosomal protein S8 [Alphaproteobacteria bacterium]